MDTLARIKPSQIEDALLVFPFSYTLKFLQFIDIALADPKLSANYLPLICKNLFFVIKTNQRELVSQKNETLKLQITRVKNQLRSKLQQNEDDLGFNVQGLKFIKQQWNLKHNFEFVDEYDQMKQDEKNNKKRVFETFV